MKASTTESINHAIKPFGLHIIRGRGYQYFLDRETQDQVGESIMTCYLKNAPLDYWINEAAYCWGQRESETSPFDAGTCRDALKAVGNQTQARAILNAAAQMNADPLTLWELTKPFRDNPFKP